MSVSPSLLGLGCVVVDSWGPAHQEAPGHPLGGDSVSVCAFQNQLLTKGMVILRDKIRFYEGESGGPWPGRCAGPHHLLAWPLGIVASTRDGGTAGFLWEPRTASFVSAPRFWVDVVALLLGRDRHDASGQQG